MNPHYKPSTQPTKIPVFSEAKIFSVICSEWARSCKQADQCFSGRHLQELHAIQDRFDGFLDAISYLADIHDNESLAFDVLTLRHLWFFRSDLLFRQDRDRFVETFISPPRPLPTLHAVMEARHG